MNKEPQALRLAQFFEHLSSLQHHLSAETALHALEDKLTEVIGKENYDRKSREKRAKIILYGNELGDHRTFNFLVQREQLHELLEWIAHVYENFEDFLSDYFRRDPDPAPVDSYWNSYRIDVHASEQYIEEDYRLGVSIWSCRDRNLYEDMRNLFDSLH